MQESIKSEAIPDITRAAERYLEQYGDPLVTNTYLKIAMLCLAALCVMLGLLVFKSPKALASAKQFIIRISDAGHAEAIDYRNFDYRPRRRRTKITSRAGPTCTLVAIGTRSNATRPRHSTS